MQEEGKAIRIANAEEKLLNLIGQEKWAEESLGGKKIEAMSVSYF